MTQVEKQPASLRDRTVARWQKRGALGGALIGRLAAGGGDRDRAERPILGLARDGHIDQGEDEGLKGLSNAELSDLVAISAAKTGIAATAERRIGE
jgi:hypothetical protein